jgi:hypothetical protein
MELSTVVWGRLLIEPDQVVRADHEEKVQAKLTDVAAVAAFVGKLTARLASSRKIRFLTPPRHREEPKELKCEFAGHRLSNHSHDGILAWSA